MRFAEDVSVHAHLEVSGPSKNTRRSDWKDIGVVDLRATSHVLGVAATGQPKVIALCIAACALPPPRTRDGFASRLLGSSGPLVVAGPGGGGVDGLRSATRWSALDDNCGPLNAARIGLMDELEPTRGGGGGATRPKDFLGQARDLLGITSSPGRPARNHPPISPVNKLKSAPYSRLIRVLRSYQSVVIYFHHHYTTRTLVHEHTNHFVVAVTEWLAYSPPTKANRVQSPAGSLPNFPKRKFCRTMSPVGGFSRGSPVSPPVLAFRRCFTLIGSQDPEVRSRPNRSTHSPRQSFPIIALGTEVAVSAQPFSAMVRRIYGNTRQALLSTHSSPHFVTHSLELTSSLTL
ncbi:hypothetical protein PR048_007668 [Dryococelus australis]|uniref:Uncharacterized protein n=1 Tax=Dryococelus australis TaxID=614101 RepID=A0ABQ9HUW1_9NEOP|nr:hypothetical protein PR048_007668 [Dryococelus australis]